MYDISTTHMSAYASILRTAWATHTTCQFECSNDFVWEQQHRIEYKYIMASIYLLIKYSTCKYKCNNNHNNWLELFIIMYRSWMGERMFHFPFRICSIRTMLKIDFGFFPSRLADKFNKFVGISMIDRLRRMNVIYANLSCLLLFTHKFSIRKCFSDKYGEWSICVFVWCQPLVLSSINKYANFAMIHTTRNLYVVCRAFTRYSHSTERQQSHSHTHTHNTQYSN